MQETFELRRARPDDRLAVEARGLGLGQLLTQALVTAANEVRLNSLSLLTTTAEAFFARLGFERVQRSELPPALGNSEELCGAFPCSAAAMVMRLYPLGRSATVFRADVHGAWSK